LQKNDPNDPFSDLAMKKIDLEKRKAEILKKMGGKKREEPKNSKKKGKKIDPMDTEYIIHPFMIT